MTFLPRESAPLTQGKVARPVITTDAPGCRETVIDGKNGFLVPMRNAKALAGAMIRHMYLFEEEHRRNRSRLPPVY